MRPILENRTEHKLKPIDPRKPVTFKTTEKQFVLPDDCQVVQTNAERSLDTNGRQIEEKTRLVRDSRTGAIIDLDSAFQCVQDYRFHSLKSRAKALTPAEVNLVLDPDARPINRGYCYHCWFLVGLWKHLAKKTWKLLLTAFCNTSSDAKPPASVAPAAKPTAPQAAPETTPVTKIAVKLLLASLLGASAFAAGAWPQPTGVRVATGEVEMNAKPQKPTLKDVEILLEAAARTGLDQKNVSSFGWATVTILKQKLELGEVDGLRYRLLNETLARHMETTDEHWLAFQQPDPDKIAAGNLQICHTLLNKIRVIFSSELLRRGQQFFASTGMGKTTLMLRQAIEWVRLDLPAIVIAQKPDQVYFALAKEFPGRCLLLKCGVDRFYNVFGSVIGQVRDFLNRKLMYFQACYNKWDSAGIIHQLYDQFAAEQPQTGQVAPTLSYLIGKLVDLKLPRDLFNPLLKPSVYNTLCQIQGGSMGVTLDCQRGLDWAQILSQKKVVVIQTDSLNEVDTHFLCSSLLSDLRAIKDLNPGLPDVQFIVDEAGPLLAKRWDIGQHASPLAAECVLARGSGICLVLGYHSVAGINPLVRANSGMTIIGNLSSGEDLLAAGQAAALSPEQRLAISHLQPGQAILKMSGVPQSEPFLIGWEPLPATPRMSEAERLRHNAAVWQQLPAIIPSGVRTTVTVRAPAQPNQAAQIILRDIARRPFIALTERARTLELIPGRPLNFRELQQHLADLEQQGLCTNLTLRMNHVGGNSVFTQLTVAGHAAINSPLHPHRAGTDYQHYWLQEFVRYLLAQRNIQAELEPKRPASQVDLGFQDPATGRCVAVEICLTTARVEPQKIGRTLQDWERCLIIVPTPGALRDLERCFLKDLSALPPDLASRVTLILPYHITAAARLQDVYDAADLVYQPPLAARRKVRLARRIP